ncbi:MAG: YHS domain-containing (seleno)protein [Arenicellales bacterium]
MSISAKAVFSTIILTVMCFALTLPPHGLAADKTSQGPISTSRFGKVAIGGYDTVAYHDKTSTETHTATEGKKAWVHEWREATWRFGSEQSYLAFKADPEKYRPAFGGFCSNALSLGEGLIRTDGTHWEILDDRLHLFYAARGRDRWLDGNHAQYLEQANQAWKEITGYDDQ